jgi:hypothetical protein
LALKILYLVDPANFLFLLGQNRILLLLDNSVEVFVELFEAAGVAQLHVVFEHQDQMRLGARAKELLRSRGNILEGSF